MKLSKSINNSTIPSIPSTSRSKSAMKPSAERGTFYNSQYQSIANRHLLKYVNQARRSKIQLSEIMQSLHSVCDTMCFGSTNRNAMKQVSTTAHHATQYLFSTFRKITNNDNKFNRAIYSNTLSSGGRARGSTGGDKPFLTEVYNEKDDVYGDNEENPKLGLSQISYVHLDGDGEDNLIDEDALAKSYSKQRKLKELKGEIQLADQLKKYGRNKRFEKIKVFREGHFYRKEKDSIKYKPKAAYVKENLYFKRNYNDSARRHNKIKEANDNINYDQLDLQSQSLLTKHKPRLSLNSNSIALTIPLSTPKLQTPYGKKANKSTRKLFLSSRKETTQFYDYSKDHTSATATNTECYNPLTTTSTKMNSTLMTSSCRPMTAMTGTATLPTERFSAFKSKKTSTRKKKLNLGHLKALYTDIYKEGEAFKRTIKEDFTKELQPRKKKHKPLPIKELRKELNLDYLDQTLDEDKLTINNAQRVMKNLDKKSQELLNRIVKEMMHKEDILNKKYYEESNYDQKLRSIKEKKEFQKVVDEMMGLKKKLKVFKPYDSEHEKKKLISIVKEKQEEEWVDTEKLQEYVEKCHVMNTIKPLINIDHRGPFKRTKKLEDIDF